MKAIIIGSNRGIQHLDSDASYPMALLGDRRGKRAIDWTLSALDKVGIEDIIFIGGYHIEKVIRSYPNMKFYYNSGWDSGNDLQALSCAVSELDSPCIIVKSEVVFYADALEKLLSSNFDLTIGVEKNQTEAKVDFEDDFTGITSLSIHASSKLKNKIESLLETDSINNGHMPNLRDVFYELDIPLKLVELDNNYSRIYTPQSLARFVFNTKAQTLERLQPLVTQATILDQVRFTVKQWRDDSKKIIRQLQASFPEGELIIRSSALNEDSWNESQAGNYDSILGIEAQNSQALYNSIESVINSFKVNGSSHENDEIFVQSYLENVELSGVLFTRNAATAAPYIIINYDNTSSRTDTVTSGKGEDLKTTIIYKQCTPKDIPDQHMAHLINVVHEIEELTGHDALDIEFAFDKDKKCYILQVRVLCVDKTISRILGEDFHEELTLVKNYIDELMHPRPNLHCDYTILSNMPDWNPAELIGCSPRPLALSLFQYLITDRVWGQARTACGYKETYPEPLVLVLSGHPYVDVRASFNSFIPASLDEKLSEKLVCYYMDRLESNPEFHDKVEFEVAITCMDFNFSKNHEQLRESGFTKAEINEINRALLKLTDDIVCNRIATIDEQMDMVSALAPRREGVLKLNRSTTLSYVRAIDNMLSDCKRLGTLPFSIVARYAFIATSFLKSLEALNVFSTDEVNVLQQSIPTVATDIFEDFGKLRMGHINRKQFLDRYGHLRPGTYDIRCPSYSEDPDFYLGDIDESKLDQECTNELKVGEELFFSKTSQIDILIKKAGLSFSVPELWNFIVSAISAREKAKFEYTKNLSAALTLIAKFGKSFGFDADDMSFLSIQDILKLSTSSQSIIAKKSMERAVSLNRKNYALNESVQLPHMITSSKDVNYFELLRWHPNFITAKLIAGSVIDLESIDEYPDLQGEIVLIESADPGYDWIFGQGIKGLVTKYGGAASHMAIRAAELAIPAAIGCGDLIYSRVLKSKVIELDCSGQSIRVIR